MNDLQYVRIERKSGGVYASKYSAMRAMRKLLNPEAKLPKHKFARHKFYREFFKIQYNAQLIYQVAHNSGRL